jgi:translation initiation factor 2 beta subunit (eIF-2beta)/eIF-5
MLFKKKKKKNINFFAFSSSLKKQRIHRQPDHVMAFLLAELGTQVDHLMGSRDWL